MSTKLGEPTFETLKALFDSLDRESKVMTGHSVGFGPASVLSNATCIFQAQPQCIFLGTTLSIPKKIAKHFNINDIRVGNQSMSISANPLAAETFDGLELTLPVCAPGLIITISVTNTSYKPRKFAASICGDMMNENYDAIFCEVLRLHRVAVSCALVERRKTRKR